MLLSIDSPCHLHHLLV